MILYHGSKGGIVGPIKPVSRANADFGQGFYMGTDKWQAWDVCAAHPSPVFYEAELDLSGLRVLELRGLAWLSFVIYNRFQNKIPDFTVLKCSCDAVHDEYDVVFGVIADDAMHAAVDDFSHGIITVETCMEALRMWPLGTQYVAISQKACNNVRIRECQCVSLETIKTLRPPRKEREEAYRAFRESRLGTPGRGVNALIKEVSHYVITEDKLNSMS